MMAFVGPVLAPLAWVIRFAMFASVCWALLFIMDALVVGASSVNPAEEWRDVLHRACAWGQSPHMRRAWMAVAAIFAIVMAEAHHGLNHAADVHLRLELGILTFSTLACMAFAMLGGAGRRSLSEEALRTQALRQQEAFSAMLDERDAEIKRLRVELAAVRKQMVTREDSLRTLRSTVSSQSGELLKLLSQNHDMKDQLTEQDSAQLAEKKEL
mmetsp:Transcript_13174/g.34329  ORF Transcript_13174/g.34329 Transcript_13174/m.34329 type:complete len:213 (+) Transcript_13174:193-831(+)